MISIHIKAFYLLINEKRLASVASGYCKFVTILCSQYFGFMYSLLQTHQKQKRRWMDNTTQVWCASEEGYCTASVPAMPAMLQCARKIAVLSPSLPLTPLLTPPPPHRAKTRNTEGGIAERSELCTLLLWRHVSLLQMQLRIPKSLRNIDILKRWRLGNVTPALPFNTRKMCYQLLIAAGKILVLTTLTPAFMVTEYKVNFKPVSVCVSYNDF